MVMYEMLEYEFKLSQRIIKAIKVILRGSEYEPHSYSIEINHGKSKNYAIISFWEISEEERYEIIEKLGLISYDGAYCPKMYKNITIRLFER